MNGLFTRSIVCDMDDVYLDSLREQAQILNIIIEEEDNLKRYPSSKDLERRWTRNILSRRGEEEDIKKEFHEKRKSLFEKDSLSLEKSIKKR
jgi:hypothetical protein